MSTGKKYLPTLCRTWHAQSKIYPWLVPSEWSSKRHLCATECGTPNFFFCSVLKIERTKKKEHRCWTFKHGDWVACGMAHPCFGLREKNDNGLSWLMGVTRSAMNGPAQRETSRYANVLARAQVLYVGTTQTHTRTRALTQTHTNAHSCHYLTLQIKTLFCRWPLDQRKFVLSLAFLFFFVRQQSRCLD